MSVELLGIYPNVTKKNLYLFVAQEKNPKPNI